VLTAAVLAVAACGDDYDDSGAAATTAAASATTAAAGAATTTAASGGAATTAASGATGTTATAAGTAVGPDTSKCPSTTVNGITDTEITFGSSAPTSGASAAQTNVWAGIDAYFQYVNSKGGVTMQDGKTRTLKLDVLDDGGQPSRTKANVDQLINQDKVFSLVSVFGTAGNAAILDDADRACVPNAFAQTGSIDASGPKHPWTMVAIPPYQIEAKVLATYLQEQNPDATVAALYQNDDLGRTAFQGFQDAIKGTGIKLVASESYETTDADVTSQMTTLAASKAEVFFNASFAAKCLQAFNDAQSDGWKPLILAMFTCGGTNALVQTNPGAADGAVQSHYLKDYTAAKAAGDPAIALYDQWIVKNDSGKASPTPALGGWAIGEYVEQVLKAMPENTPASFIGTAQNMTYTSDAIYDGIKLHTDVAGNKDYFIIEGWRLDKFDQNAKVFNEIKAIDLDGTNPRS
jgi:branched-chain amino acid transport system substrate-binding protein